MTKLHQLFDEQGQSPWIDNLKRSYLTSGQLQRLVEQGIRGVTSNPTIFQKAIAGSSDYDEQFSQLALQGTVESAYWTMVAQDVTDALAVMRPVYDAAGGGDGFVSLEVAPSLAADTDGTIKAARTLHERVDRPNLMVKIPATKEGVPAIRQMISEGRNINVTLIFSLARYGEVIEAYLSGLEALVAAGGDPSAVHSVASFFVSRVDTEVDRRLDKLGEKGAGPSGKAAVAQAKLAYRLFQEQFPGPRWDALNAKGAHPQRPLWASTSTKNPAYPDLLYVDSLIGPTTVNTLPDATVEAFVDHGVLARTIDVDVEEAQQQLERLAAVGIDMDDVAQVLEDEGVASFAKSFDELMQALTDKASSLHNEAEVVDVTELLERLEARDPSLWPAGNVSANRLGWLGVVDRMAEEAADLQSWAGSIDAERVVLFGMGGSSLGPEVLRAAQQNERIIVCDTTDPLTVSSVPLDGSFFLISSKSGSTLEPNVLLAHAWEHAPDGSRFAAITDPGSSLDTLATERGFARVFRNPPDIGGRYSVLSYFGLVPAALMGYDVAGLCDRARAVDRKAAVDLGVMMGEAARSGRDKVTIQVPPGPMASFGLWVEQLIAESTGKRGTGCVPVPTTEAEEGEDRFNVAVNVVDPIDLAAEFMRWEIATAITGHVLDIDPFDEPNVTESKENTKKVLDHLPLPPVKAEPAGALLPWLTERFQPGDYVSLQAYLPYPWASGGSAEPAERAPLERLRRKVRNSLVGGPVTAGYGPRFLHSTGQLHKGGPNTLLAVQAVPRTPTADLKVPGYPYDFGTLIAAQAIGDYQSLQAHGRRVLRVEVDDMAELL